MAIAGHGHARQGPAAQGRRGRAGGAEEARDRAEKKSAKSEKKRRPRPVPALLRLIALARTPATPADVSLDIVRGRVDSIAPSPDRRRGEVRTNYQGADFQAPATAEAWRDRAAHLREQMLVTLGLWPMFPKTPLNPQVYGKLERDGYTIEKVVLETFPGFTLSGNLYRPAGQDGQGPRHPLPARPLGGRPRQSRGPAALHPMGEAGLRRLPVRHGRLQRQQAVRATPSSTIACGAGA